MFRLKNVSKLHPVINYNKIMAACLLKNIPPEVNRIILQEQAKAKAQKGTNQFSIELTIYKIIKEFERCKEVEEKPER